MIIDRRAISLHAMEALARELSLWAQPGLAIHLSGDLGAGKSDRKYLFRLPENFLLGFRGYS